MKENAYLFANFLLSSFKECAQEDIFPHCLKKADVTPKFKKYSTKTKDNYKPIRIFSNISKQFKKPSFKQISSFFDKSFLFIEVDLERALAKGQQCYVTETGTL